MTVSISSHTTHQQQGRSMIEMLGVLSIVGILTISSVSEFEKLITRNKTQKVIETFTQLIQEVLIRSSSFRQIPDGYTSYMNLAISQAAILPSGWYYKNGKLYNNMGYANFYNKNNQIQINYILTPKASLLNNHSKEICRILFTNLVIPFASTLKLTAVYRGNDQVGRWYGDNYCKEPQKQCLKNITISEIEKQCSMCQTGHTYDCSFVMFFPFN